MFLFLKEVFAGLFLLFLHSQHEVKNLLGRILYHNLIPVLIHNKTFSAKIQKNSMIPKSFLVNYLTEFDSKREYLGVKV